MKIFSWIMNRKLRPATECYSSLVPYTKGVLEEEDEIRRSVEKADTDALLQYKALDGFLSIGTLGHCHHPMLLPSIEEEEVQELQEEVVRVPGAEGNKQTVVTFMASVETTTAVMDQLEPVRPSCEIKPLLEVEKKERRRTTLAELLAADDAAARSGDSPSNMDMEMSLGVTAPALHGHGKCGKKDMVLEKGGSPAAAVAATKKLHRLMARMLKKRIHPNVTHVRGAAEDAGVVGRHGCLLY